MSGGICPGGKSYTHISTMSCTTSASVDATHSVVLGATRRYTIFLSLFVLHFIDLFQPVNGMCQAELSPVITNCFTCSLDIATNRTQVFDYVNVVN